MHPRWDYAWRVRPNWSSRNKSRHQSVHKQVVLRLARHWQWSHPRPGIDLYRWIRQWRSYSDDEHPAYAAAASYFAFRSSRFLNIFLCASEQHFKALLIRFHCAATKVLFNQGRVVQETVGHNPKLTARF